MKNKKILFIVSNLKIGGGAEKSVTLITKGLKEHYDVELLTFYKHEKEYEYFVKRHDLGYTPAKSLIKKGLRYFIFAPYKLSRFLRKNHYDLVVSNTSDTNLLTLITKAIFYKKFKLWSNIRCYMTIPLYKKTFPLYKNADKIIVLTKALQKHTKYPSTVINNALETQVINYEKKFNVCKKDRELFRAKTILMVGRLTEQKNHKWFIKEVFNKLNKDVNLIILGTGPLEKELKELTKNNHNIHLLGVKDNPYAYMAKADIFVLPSLFEGMPRALMESLACGTTSIANDCPTGPREILNVPLNKEIKEYKKTKYGYLVPFNNAQEYKQAILHALKQKKKPEPDTRYELKNIIKKWVQEIEKDNK